jgi:3-deoxy-D-manno-octulosonic-acid transferase
MTFKERIANLAYSSLLRLLWPVYAARLWLRGRAEPLYRLAIGERFGFYPQAPSSGWLWLHAVSLGETRAAAALVDALRAERPGMRLLLTHGTATGRAAGQDLLRDGDHQTWLPFDTPGATRRFFAQFRPSAGVLMETEIWPNLLIEARAAKLPMVLANARLSEKSQRRGQSFGAVLGPAIRCVDLVLAQTDGDAARLRSSGARIVEVSGNLKFDLTPDAAQLALGAEWSKLLGRDVVLAAITREGEEAMLLDAWLAPAARRAFGDALLLIVPRHPQRFDEVAAMVRSAGLSLARRSDWVDAPPPEALHAQVWLGDSMREMALYYATAKVALLGGSFAPLGGHNLIEAAACGCPLIMGSSTFNFAEAAELSLKAGASLRANDMQAAVGEAAVLLGEPARLRELSANAVRFAGQHRGAASRMARRIASLMP